MAEATNEQVREFIQVGDEFFVKYAQLTAPETRARVYASGDPALIADYEAAVRRGGEIKSGVDRMVGAWNAFKSSWAAVTDVTSTFIGDVIDEFRSWFGYEPAPGVGAYDISPISGGKLGQWRGGGTIPPEYIPLAQWRGGGTIDPRVIPLAAYDVSPISGGQLGALGALGIAPILVQAGWLLAALAGMYAFIKTVDLIFIRIEADNIQADDPTVSRAEALRRAADIVEGAGIFGGVSLPLIAAAAITAWLLFGRR